MVYTHLEVARFVVLDPLHCDRPMDSVAVLEL